MNSMNKMKTVELGSRGQLVIPQEFRKDLDLKEKETLVIIEKGDELILKKQSSVLEKLEGKERTSVWSEQALRKIWDNTDDDVWEKYL